MHRPCHAQSIKIKLGRDAKEPFEDGPIKHRVVTEQIAVAPIKG
jgi:hypothetical protein